MPPTLQPEAQNTSWSFVQRNTVFQIFALFYGFYVLCVMKYKDMRHN